MTEYRGNLRKMRVFADSPARYELPIGDSVVAMNPLIGSPVCIEYHHAIRCVECGRNTKKSFNQGYCYPCFKRLAACDSCIVKPELCHFAQGTCRQPPWGEANCMVPHVVYLANSSGVKVGITRKTQVPTRWLDQGAVQALPIFEVHTRRHSGLIETALKSHVADRTDWRAMLKSDPPPADLAARRDEVLTLCATAIEAANDMEADAIGGATPQDLRLNAREQCFTYPVQRYPRKVQSIGPDRQAVIRGVLEGIKGQYLILDTGVMNVRKYGGYEVTLKV